MLRSELKRTGVYFLFGPDDEGSDLGKVYIGEGDELGKRLYQHNKDKDFWERFIAVTSKDLNLTKAHVRYLEGRLLAILAAAKKVKIANKDMPTFDLLPEADISDMEAFLSEIQLVLPVVGAEFLKKPVESQSSKFAWVDNELSLVPPADLVSETFIVANSQKGIQARAREIGSEFVVLAGSIGSLTEKVSFHERQKAAREDAFETGLCSKIDTKTFQLNEDMAFTSPSAASVFLFGTARNGRTDWTIEGSGIMYGAWKDGKIENKLSSAL
ncbi:GIY-YIG nuclease family protein [Loktanella sp. M215]|uniref:GIY-YIG nuclease family protein n=1 Tax=Loktanella sp. M215 TaxID=2675431 RepID=UPI001F1C2E79|nr:GIY-YIG nuclease family protein [Loktanella sp. M215]